MIEHVWRRQISTALFAAVVMTGGFSSTALAQACGAQPVIMLAASWCGFCRQARTFFKAHDIKFTEIDVERTDHADIQLLYRQNGVPVIFIGSDQVQGFDEPKLRALLCIDE